jgi:hypothetical protein
MAESADIGEVLRAVQTGRGVYRYTSTSALDGGEWSASRSGHFTPTG